MAQLQTSQDPVIEHSPRPSEQFMKGGRDTAVVVWSVIGTAVAAFLAVVAAVGAGTPSSSGTQVAADQQQPAPQSQPHISAAVTADH
jgi:hypothetical protein